MSRQFTIRHDMQTHVQDWMRYIVDFTALIDLHGYDSVIVRNKNNGRLVYIAGVHSVMNARKGVRL